MRNLRPTPPAARGWLPLTALAGADSARIGGKAASLAKAVAGGLMVPPSWVMPVEATSTVDPGSPSADHVAAFPSRDGKGDASSSGDIPSAALAWARELLALAPEVPRWILRSSSPLEDRPGASAAGMFRSEPAAAVPEPLAAALLSVVRSGREPAVRANAAMPVAVLAQPLLELTAWWTLELRPADRVALLDGWRLERDGPRLVVLQLPWPLPPSAEATEPPFEPGASPAVWSLASQVLETFRAGAWQLEVGERGAEAVLLQVREAPARWSLPDGAASPIVPAPGPGLALAAAGDATIGAREDAPRFPVHDADVRETWRWDAEHCPTPLCPLLAGWFGRWLSSLPASHPSRLIDGRWHDRVVPSDRASTTERKRPWPAPHAVAAAMASWQQERHPRLSAELDGLTHDADALATAPQLWPGFMRRWLAFQRAYFDAPDAAQARAWARAVAHALEHWTPAIPFPGLPDTEAAERERGLQRLVHLLEATFPGEAAWTSAEQLERALARDGAPAVRACADALRSHQLRFGYVAESPWDGRGVCLEEDIRPLLRELVCRMTPLPAGEPARAPLPHPGRDARDAGDALDAAWAAAIPARWERAQARAAALLAARVLAWAEDDDVLLVRSYALFRRGARAVARRVGASALAEREVFELLPADLEGQLPQADAPGWQRAVRRGRALAALWGAQQPRGTTGNGDDAAPGLPGAQRRGLAAAPGRAAGPVRRLEAAQQDGGPLPGEVLVVRTLLPHDAVVLGRVAAVIVESGTPLGHATVLAREQGVPAVVALAGALRWLAAAERVLVDGDLGTVTILSAAPRGASSR